MYPRPSPCAAMPLHARRMVPTVASTTVEVLARAGVERVYGVAGDSLNRFTGAIYNPTDIHWVPIRHKRPVHSPQARRHTSRAASARAQAAADPGTCT